MGKTSRNRSRARAGEVVGASASSTEAKNNFGQILSQATREGRVIITKYDRPEAVLLSIEEYESLVGCEPVDLRALDAEFDEMLARMQRSEQRAGVKRLFAMSAEDLGAAASADAAEV